MENFNNKEGSISDESLTKLINVTNEAEEFLNFLKNGGKPSEYKKVK